MEAFNPLLSIFVDVILAGFDKFRIFYVFTVKMWCNRGFVLDLWDVIPRGK